jgi:hypothetical protein
MASQLNSQTFKLGMIHLAHGLKPADHVPMVRELPHKWERRSRSSFVVRFASLIFLSLLGCRLHQRKAIRIPQKKLTIIFPTGIKLSASFVPKQDNISVTVALNGATFGAFDIPGQSSPQCQLHNSWNSTVPSSSSEQEIAFIYYNGAGASNISKRATPSLELGEIR